jgi:hypothetical protein
MSWWVGLIADTDFRFATLDSLLMLPVLTIVTISSIKSAEKLNFKLPMGRIKKVDFAPLTLASVR